MNPDYTPKEIPEAELLKKSTNSLLRLYRSVRRQTIAISQINVCDCCREAIYHSREEAELARTRYGVWAAYQNRIKAILDTREHVAPKKR